MMLPNEALATTYAQLARAPASQLERLLAELGLQELAAGAVRRRARMMLPLRDPVAEAPFYLGEVLVSEAVVRRDGHEGYMLRMGDCMASASAGAAILLAFEADPAARPVVAEALAEMTAARMAAEATERAAVRATRVRFEGGDVEAYATGDFTTDR